MLKKYILNIEYVENIIQKNQEIANPAADFQSASAPGSANI